LLRSRTVRIAVPGAILLSLPIGCGPAGSAAPPPPGPELSGPATTFTKGSPELKKMLQTAKKRQ
jgi:hypothetical protein